MLKNRVALVTGAGSGIRRAGAMTMAREGASLVVTDLREDLAEATAADILAAGGGAVARPLDASDDEAIGSLVEQIVADHGRIDVAHSHADIQIAGKLE